MSWLTHPKFWILKNTLATGLATCVYEYFAVTISQIRQNNHIYEIYKRLRFMQIEKQELGLPDVTSGLHAIAKGP